MKHTMGSDWHYEKMLRDLIATVPLMLEVRAMQGYEAAQWDRLPTRLLCVLKEMDEFEVTLETPARGDRTELELADTFIYLVLTIHDIFECPTPCSKHRGREWNDPCSTFSYRWLHPSREVPNLFQPPSELTKSVRRHLLWGFEWWRRDSRVDVATALGQALRDLIYIAWEYGSISNGMEPADMVKAKIEILKRRGPTKKRLDT